MPSFVWTLWLALPVISLVHFFSPFQRSPARFSRIYPHVQNKISKHNKGVLRWLLQCNNANHHLGYLYSLGTVKIIVIMVYRVDVVKTILWLSSARYFDLLLCCYYYYTYTSSDVSLYAQENLYIVFTVRSILFNKKSDSVQLTTTTWLIARPTILFQGQFGS